MRTAVDKPWEGKQKIVIGIDIGTTQSAVAYTYLYPHGPQHAQRVTRWPGQAAQIAEQSKIPSIIWYDSDKNARAFGAEARQSDVEEKAEDEGWQLVRFFKLHLHPETMRAEQEIEVPPLPTGISLEQIYADFLRYLISHTEAFFKEKTIEGDALWKKLRGSVEFVIAHPNGWEIKEQAFLRRAAVSAGLVSSLSAADEQIHFVSEAEASVHFVMFNANMEDNFQPGVDFVVCDAGGSTVDTTVYTVDAVNPHLQLKEKKASACVQAGAIFVDQIAKAHFRRIFSNAGFRGDELKEKVDEATSNFESDTKKEFKDASDAKSIKVGRHSFSNLSLGVRKGKMVLTGEQISDFFEPCISRILQSVKRQLEGCRPKYLLVVGGFGDSPYLRRRLQDLGSAGIQIVLANDSTAKAVSDGAIIWFIKKTVIARATRYAFGVEVLRSATQERAALLGRPLIEREDGDWIHGYWDEIAPINLVLNESEERSTSYYGIYKSATPYLGSFVVTLYAWGRDTKEEWIMAPDGNPLPGFRSVCAITADLSKLAGTLTREWGVRGPYWAVNYEIRIRFGSTALDAYIVWNENGVKRRGPAAIVPSSFC